MEKLYSNTLKEIEEEKQNYVLKERDFQSKTEEHDNELKTFIQKLKQLDFENEKNLLNLEIKQ